MRRSTARAIILALIPLVLYPLTIPNAAIDSGRNPVRCARACQEILIACDERADAICLAMYGDDEKQLLDCRVVGKSVCLNVEQDCRLSCRWPREDRKFEP